MAVTAARRRPGKTHVAVKGADELRARLGPRLYRRAVGDVIERATGEMHALARERAPRRTDRAFGSIRKFVDPRQPPAYGKVTAEAANRGFRYVWALNASKKIRYRFRSGPRRGRLTRGWFTGVLRLVRRRMPAYVAEAEQRVRRGWRW